MKRYNIIFLVDAAGEHVLTCRRVKPPYEGLLNLVGGKALPGEDGLHAAYRELREETGVTAADVALLTFVVWRTEQIYWFNGTEYKAAVEAGSERRKDFAWRHFRIFGWYALAQVVFCCAMHLLGWPWWIDIIVFCAGLCAAAFATMPIKL